MVVGVVAVVIQYGMACPVVIKSYKWDRLSACNRLILPTLSGPCIRLLHDADATREGCIMRLKFYRVRFEKI